MMLLEFNFHAHQRSIYCKKHINNHFSNLVSQDDPTKGRCFNLSLSLTRVNIKDTVWYGIPW